MRINLSKRIPEGEWSSFNEPIGTGDGEKTKWTLPISAKEARGLLLMRDLEFLGPEGRRTEMQDGKSVEIPDGFQTKETPEGELEIVMDRALRPGVKLSFCALGRKAGDSFKILPLTTVVAKKLDDAAPTGIRKRSKAGEMTGDDVRDSGRTSFQNLVVDWTLKDEEDNPLICDEETKKAFLDQFDAGFFGLWARQRSVAIQAERISAHEADSGN